MTQQTSSTENSKLLSPSPPPTIPMAPRPTAGGDGGVMNKLQNVFQIIHGAGDSVRGTILGAIDEMENRGETKHHEIARRGKAELDEAYARLWGTGPSTQVQSAPASSEPPLTGYNTGPPAYHSTGGAGSGAGGLPSNSGT
ncbi:hypothetical protein B0H10DRAFT_2237951 [Mycena sp. CBHHK59/15]|nr:hypothetical protein B0H10DRAFT_2237951 [Mycena sp. CBHHK59/15]